MGFGESIYILASITTAIFLEAMPFLAIGAIFGAVIEVYMPVDRLARFIPKSFAGGIALGVSAGFVIPTCECGVVPIVRRLIKKGVPPYIAITYMLAAPIINPVVMASTYIAFRGSLTMVTGRVMVAAVVAAALGFFVRRQSVPVLNDTTLNQLQQDTCDHHDGHDGGDGCCCHCHDTDLPERSKLMGMLIHTAHEFFDMGKFLLIGAFTAAVFKTFVPQEIMGQFSDNMFLSIVGMMTLAVVLSVCSEADAFVAASFVSFPAVAQLSFMTIGPMVDLKLIGMFAATFHHRIFWALVIGPTVLILVISVILGFFM